MSKSLTGSDFGVAAAKWTQVQLNTKVCLCEKNDVPLQPKGREFRSFCSESVPNIHDDAHSENKFELYGIMFHLQCIFQFYSRTVRVSSSRRCSTEDIGMACRGKLLSVWLAKVLPAVCIWN